MSEASLMAVGHKWTAKPSSLVLQGKSSNISTIKRQALRLVFALVETIRLELMASTMSTWRSNQLGYASKARVIIHYFSTFDKHISLF